MAVWGRAALALVAVAVAFAPTLRYDLRSLFYDAPLAPLALVPLLAVVVGMTRLVPATEESDHYDRQADVIVALMLLGFGLVILRVSPSAGTPIGWQWRIDELARPFFAAGAVTLLLGLRTLWRARVVFVFLLLAWPPPWLWLLDHTLPTITGATRAALSVLPAAVVPAHQITGGDGSQFLVHHGTTGFILSVASACGGASGLTAWIVVGTALCAVLDGAVVNKVAWLVAGAALNWTLNVGRITLIFAAGHRYGEQAALAGLHPWLGYLALGVGSLAMWGLLGRFGLRVPVRPPRQARRLSYDRGAAAVPRAYAAAIMLAVAALVMSAGVARLARSAPLATVDGEATVAPFAATDLPRGWTSSLPRSFGFAKPEFGDDSTWTRWFVTPPPGRDLTATIWLDDVTTSDLNSLATYTVPACYGFHGEAFGGVGTVQIGAGTPAELLSHREGGMQWLSLDWVWPVVDPTNSHRYERLTLLEPVLGRADGVENLTRLARQITDRRISESTVTGSI
jgi:exosortase/archaeosortase family protein